METIITSPPVVLVMMLVAMAAFAGVLARLAFRPRRRDPDGEKSYACGEDVPTHLMQPDYSQFFPFAFFFTVLHVTALMIATIPTERVETFAVAFMYVLGIIAALAILFRR